MKSLSALYDWLGADHPATGGSHRTEPPNYHLRSLPGEEIHLYVKNIDNTKLIRVVDKKDWATSVSVTGAALVCSLIVSAMVGPSCYGMLASRRMEYLHEERTRLRANCSNSKSRKPAASIRKTSRNGRARSSCRRPPNKFYMPRPPRKLSPASA
jgi:hypothetical protein